MTTRDDLTTRELLITGVRWRVDVPTVGYNPHRVTRIVKIAGVSWRYCKECGGWQATNAGSLHG